MRRDTRVPWKSDRQIEGLAAAFRMQVDPTGTRPVDMVVAFEVLGRTAGMQGLELVTVAEGDMLERQAYAIGQRVFVTDEMSERARKGDVTVRFGLAHELGHAVLHNDGSNRARMQIRTEATPTFPKEESAEHQADVFAGAFLIPAASASQGDPAQVASQYNTSQQTAEIRLASLRSQLRRSEIPENREFITRHRAALSNTNSSTLFDQPSKRENELFEALAEIEGLDPAEFRRTWGNHQVARSQFGEMRRRGWFVLKDRIYGWMEIDQMIP